MSVHPRHAMARHAPGATVALVLLALAAVSLPTTAGAHSPGHYFSKARRVIRFQVRGSHGYTIGVAESSRGGLTVTVGGGPATTEYESRAPKLRSRSQSEVHGSLGRLGTFDVQFTPRGKPRQFPRYRWCSGPGPTIQQGTVHGEIRFLGERGYTRAAAHSARAELETMPGQRCHYGEAGHSQHPPRYTATLEAEHETGGRGANFEALRFAPGMRPSARRVYFQASVYQQLGSPWVARKIQVSSTTSSFRLPTSRSPPKPP